MGKWLLLGGVGLAAFFFFRKTRSPSPVAPPVYLDEKDYRDYGPSEVTYDAGTWRGVMNTVYDKE